MNIGTVTKYGNLEGGISYTLVRHPVKEGNRRLAGVSGEESVESPKKKGDRWGEWARKVPQDRFNERMFEGNPLEVMGSRGQQ